MSKYLPIEAQKIIKEIKAFIEEQNVPVPEDEPIEDPAAVEEPPVEDPAMADPNAMVDPNAIPGMEGDLTGQEELDADGQPVKKARDIGRVYELKKIYSRLISADKILNNEPDASLQNLKKMVSKSIEMFHILISNYKSYSDNIDEIIVAYYKFIIKLYARLNTKFKKISKKKSG